MYISTHKDGLLMLAQRKQCFCYFVKKSKSILNIFVSGI